MKKITACMLALLLALAAPVCVLADETAGEPAVSAESPAPAEADAPDPAPGPAHEIQGDVDPYVAQATEAVAVEVSEGVAIEATVKPPDAEETGAEDLDESAAELQAKAAKPKLKVSVSTANLNVVRPLRQPLELTVFAECAKDAQLDFVIRLGKNGAKYPLFGATNANLVLSIPAADVNALDVGDLGIYASFAGGSGIQKLEAKKVLTLSLYDNLYSLLGDRLTLHHERTSGIPLSLDVPLQALVDEPEMIPSGTLTIGKAKFQSALPGAPGMLHFDIAPELLDAIEPGGYDALLSMPAVKAYNMAELKNLSIGTMVVTDPRVQPVYLGSRAQIRAEHGASDDVDFAVRFSSLFVENVPVAAELTRDGKAYAVDVYGYASLDGEASQLSIDGDGLRKLKAGRYQLTFNTLATANNMASEPVKRELIVGSAPSISTRTLPGAYVGEAYRATIKHGGSPAPSFEVVEGRLPRGLSLSDAGVISGTPTGAGDYRFTVAASNGFEPDAERTYTLAVSGSDGEEDEEDIEAILDETTPLSPGDGLPVLPSDFKAAGVARDGVATLGGLEAPLMASLLREQDVSADELLELVLSTTGSGVPLNTAMLPVGGVKLPLLCSGRYVGYAMFAPALDEDGLDAVRFEIALIPGTSIATVTVDGERIPDVQMRLTGLGDDPAPSDEEGDGQEMFYLAPGELLPANGLELLELSVGVSYHPDSSPEYTPKRVTVDQIRKMGM